MEDRRPRHLFSGVRPQADRLATLLGRHRRHGPLGSQQVVGDLNGASKSGVVWFASGPQCGLDGSAHAVTRRRRRHRADQGHRSGRPDPALHDLRCRPRHRALLGGGSDGCAAQGWAARGAVPCRSSGCPRLTGAGKCRHCSAVDQPAAASGRGTGGSEPRRPQYPGGPRPWIARLVVHLVRVQGQLPVNRSPDQPGLSDSEPCALVQTFGR